MKRLIFIPLLFLSFLVFSQRDIENITMTVPVGDDSTFHELFWNYENAWGFEVNSTNVDGVDTLYAYFTYSVDSAEYALIWVDLDLDGVNDNPWTLSSTINLFIWGQAFPGMYIVYRLAKGTSTAGLNHYLTQGKR